jgi:hypothetical protein
MIPHPYFKSFSLFGYQQENPFVNNLLPPLLNFGFPGMFSGIIAFKMLIKPFSYLELILLD